MSPIRVASVQFNHQPGDKTANMATIRGFVGAAKSQDVDLMVFPEMCVTGYWHVRNLDRAGVEGLAEPVPDGETTKALLELAKETGMTMGAGLIERDAFNPGELGPDRHHHGPGRRDLGQ